ncbi:hypothetical protein [Glaciimonas sp. PAMC28666]|uniref:hypothetical protein n=1 Tax=Glaciimonas sp. PAMC28666 TaxID=2807626 RepID=UPI00196566AB|nr:hypothetical protein [Glaciimonas sp. PAMC28666]QRX83411.1 hypothetical protein JQN73_03885 [Glaciimonas sp. PAMC28666]
MISENKKNRDSYDQGRLLDALLQLKTLKNDAALCRLLKLSPPLISKVRHGRIKMSGEVMIRIHETFGITFIEIRGLLGEDKPPSDRQ